MGGWGGMAYEGKSECACVCVCVCVSGNLRPFLNDASLEIQISGGFEDMYWQNVDVFWIQGSVFKIFETIHQMPQRPKHALGRALAGKNNLYTVWVKIQLLGKMFTLLGFGKLREL